MKITYTQLNDDAKDCGCFSFPYEVAGVFNDGVCSFPIGMTCIGKVLYQHEKAGDGILEADKAFLDFTKLKKIPHNVSVTIDF